MADRSRNFLLFLLLKLFTHLSVAPHLPLWDSSKLLLLYLLYFSPLLSSRESIYFHGFSHHLSAGKSPGITSSSALSPEL